MNIHNIVEAARQLGLAEGRLEAAVEKRRKLLDAAARGMFVVGTYDADRLVAACAGVVELRKNELELAILTPGTQRLP